MIREMKRKERTQLSPEQAQEKWTGNYGLQNLYVQGASEAEDNIVEKVKESCIGTVCEVGCGDGRVAAHFPLSSYTGVDISAKAINRAKNRCPSHNFKVVGYDENYPEADTFVFYTVLLHVPDEIIESVFQRAKEAGAKRIVIYEVMLGWIRDYSKHDNFHRNPAEFVKRSGFKEKALYFVKSRFFPWHGNILILERD